MSFAQRQLTITLGLGMGSFGNSGFNLVKLPGLRASVLVEKYGSPGLNTAQGRVYGLPLSMMNQISSLWVPYPQVRNNTILIEAGDAGATPATVFNGNLLRAVVNMEAPGGALEFFAITAARWLAAPVPPISFPGAVDAAVIMAGLAKTMGLTFENNGASAILSNPYFPGVAIQQANECAHAAGFELAIDDDTLAIWPKGGIRSNSVTDVSSANGMVGYPAYDGSNIVLKTLYNPAIFFGGHVNVKSQIQAACGVWYIWGLTHNLQSQTPGGTWFSEVKGLRPTQATGVGGP